MRGAAVALAALAVGTSAGPVAAQALSVGPTLVVGDYREVADDQQYQGAGAGAAMVVTRDRLSIDVALARVTFDPTDGGEAVESFTARQFDLRVRYYLTGPVSAEAGLMVREVDPDFAAQSAGAVRLGARLSNDIGRGVRLGLRGTYLAGARFSGGGTAPGGFEIGLGVGGEFLRGRLRVTADYEFQYLNRKTDDGAGAVSVPIQQALLRLGAAVAF